MPVEPDRDTRQLDLRDYLNVLRRRKLIIVAAALIVGGVALGASLLQTKEYEASASVLLGSRTSERILVPGGSQSLASSRAAVETEIEVMRSRSVSDQVAKAIGGPPSVAIATVGDTQVVVVRATDAIPARAARVANTYARTYITTRRTQIVDDLLSASSQVQTKINEIDRQLGEASPATSVGGSSTFNAEQQSLLNQRTSYTQQLNELELAGNITREGGAQLVSEASVPTTPVRPTPRRNLIAGLFAGLVFGVGLALLFEYLDDTVRTKEDLQRASHGLTILGLIPMVQGWKERDRPRVVSITSPSSPAAEAYRSLRTSVQFLSVERPIKCIQLTSPSASEGKTTTIANLAVALARAGQEVVIVCCDLRRPRVHEFFDLSNAIGFTSVLVRSVSLAEAIQQVPGEARVSLLASGPPPPNPSELLGSRRTVEILDELKERFDVILVDSPPVLPVTDAIILSGVVDATIIVGTARRATRRTIHRTIEALNQVGAPLVGAVFNGVKADDGYGDRYGYQYGYHPEHAPQTRRRRNGGSRSRREAKTTSSSKH